MIRNFSMLVKNLITMDNPDLTQNHEICCQTIKILNTDYKGLRYSLTVHKVLCHSTQYLILFGSTGKYTEESIESMNKSYRDTRQHHSRKIGPYENLKDMFSWIYACSDILVQAQTI